MSFILRTIATALSLTSLSWALPLLAAPDLSASARSGQVSQQNCMASAQKGIQKLKVTDLDADASSISGQYQGYTVMVLCHPHNDAKDASTQVIIVAGESGKKAEEIRILLRQAIDAK